MRRKLALVAGAAVLAMASAGALAYVRSITDKGTPIFWPGSCAWISADSDGSPDLPIEVIAQTLQKSVANWQSVTLDAGCSYLRILIDPSVPAETARDRKNIVKFRTGRWCRPAEPSNGIEEDCYAPAAAAITTVFYLSDPGRSDDGEIIDADIQMNDVNFTFVVEPTSGQQPRPQTQFADLENTLTHELGHLQGLDHTCWDQMPPYQDAPPRDNAGLPIPDCQSLTDRTKVSLADEIKIETATMYNTAAPGETTKRTPKNDDIQGICAIYPKADDPHVCARPSIPRGCTLASSRAPGSAATPGLCVLALGLLVRRLRRR